MQNLKFLTFSQSIFSLKILLFKYSPEGRPTQSQLDSVTYLIRLQRKLNCQQVLRSIFIILFAFSFTCFPDAQFISVNHFSAETIDERLHCSENGIFMKFPLSHKRICTVTDKEQDYCPYSCSYCKKPCLDLVTLLNIWSDNKDSVPALYPAWVVCQY